jgi:hypothetical protein
MTGQFPEEPTMTSTLHLMSIGGIPRHLSRIAARVLDVLRPAHRESHVATRNLAKDPPGHIDEDGGTPAAACQLNEAPCDASLVPEAPDTRGVHALVSF